MAEVGREGVRPAADHQRLFPNERQSPSAAHQGGLPLSISPLRYPFAIISSSFSVVIIVVSSGLGKPETSVKIFLRISQFH